MFSTSDFNFDKTTKILSAEISELRFAPGITQLLRGLVIKSQYTGKEVFFAWKKTHFDSERDITHYTYTPQDECNVKQLVLWND